MKQLCILVLLAGLFSCNKKKEEPEPQPAVQAPVVVPAKTSEMSATLNGNAWQVTGNQTATASISQTSYNSSPKQYVIAGRTSPNSNGNSIHLGFSYATGTVTLASFTNFYALYIDSTGTSYSVKSGTLNIIALDTSHIKSPVCDKFKATFSFVTDKLLGVSYTVTGGVIDFEAP